MRRRHVWIALITAVFCVATGYAHDQEGSPAFGTTNQPSVTRWSMDVGLGVRLWDLSEYQEEDRAYLERARLGPAWALDVAAFPWRQVGLGLTYSGFMAVTEDDDIGFPNGSRGAARDEYEVHYVAPAVFMIRPFLEGRASLVGQGGAGVVFYRNESPRGQFPGVVEGVTWGLHAAASADYHMLPWLGVGVAARLTHGSLKSIHYNAMSTSISPISLTRFDLSAGLRFYP